MKIKTGNPNWVANQEVKLTNHIELTSKSWLWKREEAFGGSSKH
jgi:hypothetical protein